MISRVICISNNSAKNFKNISFKAGKIELFSDFDRTYFPASQGGMKKMSPNSHPWFAQYCTKFKNFLNNTREGLKFHITTGRTFGEYQTISELIKDRGFELPLPDTFIAKNGSDEYIKIGTDEDFYTKGIFPFSYDRTNTEKEKRLKELTGWDGPKIKEKLKELLKEHDFRIVEGDSEYGIGDYGSKSLFASGKLTYENGKIFYGTDKPDWVAGLRNDGNCKIFVTYPPDMDTVPNRKEVLKEINKKMVEYEKSIGANKIHSYIPAKNPKDCGGRLYQVIEPHVDDKLLKRTENIYEQGLTKLYDTKEAVKNAIKNNDLVIVAGDSSNDFNMLNPLQYIDIPTSSYDDKFLKLWDDCVKDPTLLSDVLDEKNPLHKELIKQLNDLPFIGIIAGNQDSNLKKLSIAYGPNSKFNKIVAVENGELENGIKEAVKLYCEQNPEYANKLSPDLRKEILEINSSQNLKKKFNNKYFAITVIAIVAALSVIFGIKKIKSNKGKTPKPLNTISLKVDTPKCFEDIINQKV